MTTLITGATGHVGRLIVTELLERGEDVRALSRDASSAGLPDAVTVVEGSLATAPAAAFAGVHSIFLFPADEGVDEFVEAAVSAGVSRFVVLSSLAVSGRNARDADSATAIHHRAVEEAVTSRTAEYTILRPGNFANNLLFWAFPIRSGYPVRIPYPTSSQVLIHEADVAFAAARALAEPVAGDRILELTGPASLTKIEQLAAISDVVGRELPHVEVSAHEFRADMNQYMPADIIDMLLRYWSETVDEPEEPLASPTGNPGLPLARWAEDHRADFVG
jgi:uncharacterized protein YbjT (DUF2867 family)